MVGVGAGDSPTEPYLSVNSRTGMDFSTQRVNLNLPTLLTAPTSSSRKTVGLNNKVRDHPEERQEARLSSFLSPNSCHKGHREKMPKAKYELQNEKCKL